MYTLVSCLVIFFLALCSSARAIPAYAAQQPIGGTSGINTQPAQWMSERRGCTNTIIIHEPQNQLKENGWRDLRIKEKFISTDPFEPLAKLRSWFNDLVDWSQRTSDEASLWLNSPDTIAQNGSGFAALKLAYLLDCTIDTKHIELYFLKYKVTVPFSTSMGRKKFLSLLDNVAPPMISSPRPLMGGTLKPWFLHDPYANEHKLNPNEYIQKWQQKVQEQVKQLHLFTSQHSQDRYLGAYAELYAAILHLHWDTDLHPVEQIFASVEHTYHDVIEVAVMAQWYRILTLSLVGDLISLKNAMQEMEQRYGTYDWWVVHKVRDNLKSPLKLRTYAEGYGFTPVRDKRNGHRE